MAAASLPPLRPYQLECARAIADSVVRDRGLSFSVMMARQAGKNETSARLEMMLLAHFAARSAWRTGVKCAPTLRPQALLSMRRLEMRLREAGLGQVVEGEDGYSLSLGTARMVFLSAEPESNVVGHTADMILEVDEAQDVDIEKFDKEFRPMAASTAATTVYYGTAWDDASLLERAKQAHLALERRDGVRRHFEYDWQVVAAVSEPYGRYVEAERQRLGADHPLFQTQYCLKTLPGLGRLFSGNDLAVLQGGHARGDGAVVGERYVAGLDVGGSGELSGTVAHDATVLTIGRVFSLAGVGDEPRLAVDVVRHYVWTGVRVQDMWSAALQLLRRVWRVERVVVDATGLGDAAGVYLQTALGESRVERLTFTQRSKSELGFGLLAAVRSGRCCVYAADGSEEYRTFWREVERARAEYLPSGVMRFYVEESEGHDDYLVSLALCVRAMAGGEPRVARGRLRDGG